MATRPKELYARPTWAAPRGHVTVSGGVIVTVTVAVEVALGDEDAKGVGVSDRHLVGPAPFSDHPCLEAEREISTDSRHQRR